MIQFGHQVFQSIQILHRLRKLLHLDEYLILDHPPMLHLFIRANTHTHKNIIIKFINFQKKKEVFKRQLMKNVLYKKHIDLCLMNWDKQMTIFINNKAYTITNT